MGHTSLTGFACKTFPNRTEGSVKKHWYKVGDNASGLNNTSSQLAGYALRGFRRGRSKTSTKPLRYDRLLIPYQSAALLAAIKEYEASKWKVIGAKVGKPAKVPQDPSTDW